MAAIGIHWLMTLAAVSASMEGAAGREFPMGRSHRLSELPLGVLRLQIGRLPGPAQERALQWLGSFHFTEADLVSLRADSRGGILFACPAVRMPREPEAIPGPDRAGVAGTVSTPAPRVFHSRPGAANVLYLNFSGETVVNTEWNGEVGRSEIPAVAFSLDADPATFSEHEQEVMEEIWQRVAEDFAPFDINVTTERPNLNHNRTAVALITRSTDANGDPNPYHGSGGVAYVNVFGTSQYSRYRPAWIYHNNLGNTAASIAEAASHEIGHNLGLSHDGRTDGSEYYGGHGSGELSWGPLMGAPYGRNVTQWSKGDYALASNTQDDLATLAAKLVYRPDDHGGTPGTATALVLSGGTNIVSTTPADDPGNLQGANKGVLERTTDVDVFSLVTGTGPVRLAVEPWVTPAGAGGGNVDLHLELRTEGGEWVVTSDPASQLSAVIQAHLSEGRYFLYVRNAGAGSPLASPPTGYTHYGSVGQYFLSGHVTAATTYVAPPVAELLAVDLTRSGQVEHAFSVVYADDLAMDVSTLDSRDLLVTGPNGYEQMARWISVDTEGNGTPRTATYAVNAAGGGAWGPEHNGQYTVFMRPEEVTDTQGYPVTAGRLGQFAVEVPVTIYSANMDTDPGWVLGSEWQYGEPAYSRMGPAGGFTGSKVIAYNLDGNYANNLGARYAETPAIARSGASTLTLRFQRWLRVLRHDAATLQVSVDGGVWLPLWSSTGPVLDDAWQGVQYPLPAEAAMGATFRLRWGLGSNPAQNDIGWNIDDVEVLGDGLLDTDPPAAALLVADVTMGGSPSHSCSVTYTDASGIRLATLDAADLLVIGPNGDSNMVEFVGADLPLDGSPLTGTYSVAAPGGAWDATDNGVYRVTLVEGAVEDTQGNVNGLTELGGFEVAISIRTPELLFVGLNEEGAMELVLRGTAGMEVMLEVSEDLGEWTRVTSLQIGDDGRVAYVDVERVGKAESFYRARVVP